MKNTRSQKYGAADTVLKDKHMLLHPVISMYP